MKGEATISRGWLEKARFVGRNFDDVIALRELIREVDDQWALSVERRLEPIISDAINQLGFGNRYDWVWRIASKVDTIELWHKAVCSKDAGIYFAVYPFSSGLNRSAHITGDDRLGFGLWYCHPGRGQRVKIPYEDLIRILEKLSQPKNKITIRKPASKTGDDDLIFKVDLHEELHISSLDRWETHGRDTCSTLIFQALTLAQKAFVQAGVKI